MSERVPCAVALGANLGDARATLRSARVRLVDGLKGMNATGLRFSSLWETEPVGPPQPRFLNAVMFAEVPAVLEPLVLVRFLLGVETAMGRVRAERWGPRVLDLDLLFVGGHAVASAELELPHPRARERGFVLWPLLEVCTHAPLLGAVPVDVEAAARHVGRDGMHVVAAPAEW